MEDEILEEKFRELTMPSGKMSQRFSQLEKQIQQPGAKSSD